jgi:arylformamidase
MARIFDLTHRIHPGIAAYPGDPPYSATVSLVATGKSVPDPVPNLSRIHLGLHVGTHGDAPFHFVPAGPTIEQVELQRGLGPACLVPLEFLKPRQEILAEHFAPFRENIQRTRRVLLRTGWDKRFREADYFTHHPVISTQAAEAMIDWGILTVAMDFPSVDYTPYATHFLLLEKRIFIVENLTGLERLPLDHFSISMLPLPLEGRDGSPIRAVAWTDDD